MILGLKLHWQYDAKMTLCTRKLGEHHQIKFCTTNLFEVECSHCFRRILRGQVPHEVFYASYEQPIESNDPRQRIIDNFERKYRITLASDQRESLFETYGIDTEDEEVAERQLDEIMEITLRAMT